MIEVFAKLVKKFLSRQRFPQETQFQICPERTSKYIYSNVAKKKLHVKFSFCINLDCKYLNI